MSDDARKIVHAACDGPAEPGLMFPLSGPVCGGSPGLMPLLAVSVEYVTCPDCLAIATGCQWRSQIDVGRRVCGRTPARETVPPGGYRYCEEHATQLEACGPPRPAFERPAPPERWDDDDGLPLPPALYAAVMAAVLAVLIILWLVSR